MTNQESKNLTRESIRIGLIQLMKTHSIDDITVTALLQRAGVSRAGFYRNYPSKEAVLNEIISDFYDKISILWAENGMRESPEEMGRIVANLYNFDLFSLN